MARDPRQPPPLLQACRSALCLRGDASPPPSRSSIPRRPQAMNPSLRVTSYEERVGEESGAFDGQFWASLDGVANALDNVQARLFVDRCCVE